MTTKAVMAIDLGTVNLKIAVIDCKGKILWLSRRKVIKIKNPRFLWKKVIEEASKIPYHIKSKIEVIGITSHAPTYIVKKEEKEDLTTYAETKHLKQTEFHGLNFFEAKLIQILKENRKLNEVLGLKEYLGYMLTGKRTYDSSELRINTLSNFLNVDMEFFENLLGKPHTHFEPIGYLRKTIAEKMGFKELPVIVGPSDAICSVLGVGCLQPKCANLNLGYTVALLSVIEEKDAKALRDSNVLNHIVKNMFLAVDAIIIGHAYTFIQSAFKHYGKEDENIPLVIPMIRKGYNILTRMSLINISPSLSRDVVKKALVLSALLYLKNKLSITGISIDEIKVSGGLASERIAYLVANVFDTVTCKPEITESSILGIASLTISYLNNEPISNVVKRLVKCFKTYTPISKEVVKYRKIATAYRKIYNAIKEYMLDKPYTIA